MSLQRLYGVFIGLRPGLGRNDRSCLQLDLAGRIEQIGDEDTTVFMAATMSSSLIATSRMRAPAPNAQVSSGSIAGAT
jgi:hypothetical protein